MADSVASHELLEDALEGFRRKVVFCLQFLVAVPDRRSLTICVPLICRFSLIVPALPKRYFSISKEKSLLSYQPKDNFDVFRFS